MAKRLEGKQSRKVGNPGYTRKCYILMADVELVKKKLKEDLKAEQMKKQQQREEQEAKDTKAEQLRATQEKNRQTVTKPQKRKREAEDADVVQQQPDSVEKAQEKPTEEAIHVHKKKRVMKKDADMKRKEHAPATENAPATSAVTAAISRNTFVKTTATTLPHGGLLMSYQPSGSNSTNFSSSTTADEDHVQALLNLNPQNLPSGSSPTTIINELQIARRVKMEEYVQMSPGMTKLHELLCRG